MNTTNQTTGSRAAKEPTFFGCYDGLRGEGFTMTLAQALGASHQGECYNDCVFLREKLIDQAEATKREDYIESLAEAGAWTREELAEMSDAELQIKAIWMAACDIRENQSEAQD